MIYASTVGLLASHRTFSAPKLVRVTMEEEKSGNIRLYVVSGHNLGRMPRLGTIIITLAEFEDRPRDNIEEARWAFSKFNLEIG